MAYANIRYTRRDGIATLTIDRPDVRNAIDPATAEEMESALAGAEKDPEVAVLIITGGGEKVFVSGADLKELQNRATPQALEACLNRLLARLESFPKPTIAALNGHTLGGGLELALACDLRIAAEGIKLGFPEVALGIIPGAGGTQRLPRLVGMGWAKELILTGDLILADRAAGMGLLNRVAPRSDLEKTTRDLAKKLASRGPVALRLAKAALNLSARVPLDSGLSFEVLAQTVLFGTRDKREGIKAFLEKREPNFKGE